MLLRLLDPLLLWLSLLAVLLGAGRARSAAAETVRPNLIVILTDDQGYADVGVYGAQGFATPRLDRMAREGMKFTQFYAGAAACSASRASLLTGCYAQRISIPAVIGDKSGVGLHASETTIAGLLKTRGYDIGNADGVLGTKSRQAISDFQTRTGLTANGSASGRVLDALRKGQ